jgi:hypothetical protein
MKPHIHIPRVLLLAVCSALLVPLFGCANNVPYMAPVKPPLGAVFINAKAPLTTDVDATPAGQKITRVSSSETFYFHDVLFSKMNFSWGQADLKNIARKGDIDNVCWADYEILNVLGIYGRFTIHVYGY